MTLLLHRAARTDRLADGLAGLLAQPPEDPFAEDLVVVPARGVERWLTQRLSHRLGAASGREDAMQVMTSLFRSELASGQRIVFTSKGPQATPA